MEDWGYPVDRLAELAARGDNQADGVDALLAIILNRGGYTHDDADVAAAEKVAKAVGAKMTPHAYLVSQHKAPEKAAYNYRGALRPGQKNSAAGLIGLVVGVFVVIVVVAVVVVASR